MLSVDDMRKKLLTQRRNLFRQVAQTEDELLWLETDVESETQERGQGERMVQLLDRLDERMKAEIEAIDRALVKVGQRSTVDVRNVERPSPSPGWRHSPRRPCVWLAHRRGRSRRR